MPPKISIVTISYNSQATIEETINSVLSQDYDNLEYIIIDGKSTDDTMLIINKYKDRIATIVSEKDKGISDAFNKGVSRATGDIIGLINSDDILLPHALRNLAEHYDGKTDVYRGNVLNWNDKTGATFREVPAMKFPIIPIHVKVAHQATFITPEAYRRYGVYDTAIRYPMDLELLLRFYRKGATMKKVDVDIAKFRYGGATSDELAPKKRDYLRLVRNNGGTALQAHLYWSYLLLFDKLKKASNILFGEDFKRRLKYGKTK